LPETSAFSLIAPLFITFFATLPYDRAAENAPRRRGNICENCFAGIHGKHGSKKALNRKK